MVVWVIIGLVSVLIAVFLIFGGGTRLIENARRITRMYGD